MVEFIDTNTNLTKTSSSSFSSANEIVEVLDGLKDLLLEKNRKYGNSALNPIRIFSHADATEQIRVRIDDKIARVQSGQLDEDEDVIIDLMGYLVLYLISLRKSLKK